MARHMDEELFRLCKADLMLYPARRRRWEWLIATAGRQREEVPDGPGLDPRSRKSQGIVSRPTEREALANVEGNELQGYIDMMDSYFSTLDNEEMGFVQLSYFERKSRTRVMYELHVSEKRYYRIMEQALTRYAIMSGLLYNHEAAKKGVRADEKEMQLESPHPA